MITYIAVDKNDIPRVYGYASTDMEAINQCNLALKDYVQRKNQDGVMVTTDEYIIIKK